MTSAKRTGGAAGEGEDDDVVVGPGVVIVRGEEGQPLHPFLPQIQQHGGVDHGHGEAAQPVTVPGGEVLGRPTVVSLRDGRMSKHSQRRGNK